mmetsp:Transcript_38159/g.120175  ORF Transcript_38159/g.120175 Transcript_38159/m.120175 type:complete len:214 (-) Transcript_38159:163-804(-)
MRCTACRPSSSSTPSSLPTQRPPSSKSLSPSTPSCRRTPPSTRSCRARLRWSRSRAGRRAGGGRSGSRTLATLARQQRPPPLGRRVAEDGVSSRHLECEQVMAVQKAGKLKAVALSEDQKPDTPAEQKRIEKAGGFVSPPEEEWGGPARVWLDANMTLPGLAMARSIGDHLVGGKGVIAKPEVKEVGAAQMQPRCSPDAVQMQPTDAADRHSW